MAEGSGAGGDWRERRARARDEAGEAPPGGPAGPSLGQRRALTAILFAALALRLWFALDGLDSRRFYDERYVFENVRRLLNGHLQPANAWFPSLAHLPQAGILWAADAAVRAFGIDGLRVRDASGGFTAAAYAICRTLQVLIGMLGLVLTYRVGRRLFGASTGILAAAFLAIAPFHIKQSAYIKPDALLVVCFLVALWAALDLAERPTWRRYVLVGVAIGLVASTKPNGVPIALAPALAAILHVRRRASHLLRLVAAGVVSVAVFVLLNPYFLMVFDYLGRNARIHRQAGAGRASVLGRELDFIVGPAGHGLVLGALALGGVVALAVLALRPGADVLRRAQIGMIPLVVAGYSGFLLIITPYGKPNLFLPLVPLTALAAAWAVVVLWRRLAAIGSLPGAARWTAALGLAVVAVVSAGPGLHWIYEMRVPSTFDAARESLVGDSRFGRLPARRLVVERPHPGYRLVVRRGRGAAAAQMVDALSEVEPQILDLSDAEIFLTRRLASEGAAFYRSRVERPGIEPPRQFSPSPFVRRGPQITLLVHLWRPTGEVPRTVRLTRSEARGVFGGELPPPQRGEADMASLVIGLPKALAGSEHRTLSVDGKAIALVPSSYHGRQRRLLARLPASARPRTIQVRVARAVRLAKPPTIELQYWKEP